MKRASILLLTSIFVVVESAAPAPAIDLGLGLLKRRTKAAEPPTKAKQLAAVLQADPDEKKRLAAAEELRGHDPRSNAEIVPALIAALQRDPSAAVRTRAAQTLGELKVTSQPAGLAMESALRTDPDAKVRDAIQAALWEYHLNGYRTPAAQAKSSQTAEPPFAKRPAPRPTTTVPTVAPSAIVGEFRPITNSVGKGTFFQPTVEPPLAKPAVAPESIPAPLPSPTTSVPTPLPFPMPMSTIPVPMPLQSTSVPTTPLPQVTIPTTPSIPVPPR